MKSLKQYFNFSFVNRYRFKLIFYISLFWTCLDFVVLLTRSEPTYYSFASAIALRSFLLFVMSLGIGYLLVFKLRKLFTRHSLWLSFLLRSLILLVAAYIVNYLIHAAHIVFILDLGVVEAFHRYGQDAFQPDWLTQKIIYWMGLFFMTQLVLEINEKYSPGVFMDILIGKYIEPKIEKRIVMFLDLKDSTPIAEKLGHQQYFKFIRDFIHQISHAIIEHGGNIYQYVGDEVVVSWVNNKKNAKRCMAALIEARKNLQKHNEDFRRKYGVIPEFRVGIHVGDVTVGEIGVIKKDIAMSGDTMNTTARIRSACSELNQKYIISEEMRELIDLKAWQTEALGMVELKGKGNGLELFSLKI
ncbi:adenylate/guanylate cyclase domain-containing protein [Aridibaculum aurantiacum]|uniref:adenylate/guanylate cyclase domain-containing protein n=1 Tax=Aridibaculum aurantiacum TaxID=2810307 RepID=UPI001A96B7CB|nr:adenylate/guanylate cyclase domain-containing protein [Aridibaculum aurantiacum]